MESYFISVVIPTHNSEKYIPETLHSVFLQTYDNFEIIVSDSGSTDKTRDVVKKIFHQNKLIKAQLLENIDMGPGRNRNMGILSAKGDWIAFLDSDDFWYRDKLIKVVESINIDPSVDLWCHSEVMMVQNKQILLEHYKKFNPNINPFLSMYRGSSLSTSAVTVKRELLIKVGLFDIDETFAHAEDWELWLRLAKVAKIGYIKDALGVFAVREGSLTSHSMKVFKALMRIVQKHHNELKKVTRFYFIEEMRFKGKAFSTAGLGFISKRNLLRGCIFLSIGILFWPFRIGYLKRVFIRLFKRKNIDGVLR